jgi:glycosyltransferase involved in cell wall biosynthesis
MAAYWADCFTTVSDITARECAQLLDKPVDIVTPNGFEPGFVPKGKAFDAARASARAALIRAAESLLDTRLPDNSLLVGIAGRLEWKNKGIDVFLQSMERLADRLYHSQSVLSATSLYPLGEVVAFVMIPYLDKPVMRFGKVTIVFVPYYLNGKPVTEYPAPFAPLAGYTYYDLLAGLDLTVFPSYYEPWGYTPLESIAFHVPTITTDVAGFGAWALNEGVTGLKDGVAVVHRTDSNFNDVVENIAMNIQRFMQQPAENIESARKAAATLAKKAEWKNFFKYYRKAYDIALTKSLNRE